MAALAWQPQHQTRLHRERQHPSQKASLVTLPPLAHKLAQKHACVAQLRLIRGGVPLPAGPASAGRLPRAVGAALADRQGDPSGHSTAPSTVPGEQGQGSRTVVSLRTTGTVWKRSSWARWMFGRCAVQRRRRPAQLTIHTAPRP